MTTTCGCGETITSEAHARRHAKDCGLQGYPRGWAEKQRGPRIGELFAGYGGLGMGIRAAIGGDVAWVSEIDKGACKVLAHRFPDAPNLGDITAMKWTPDCPTCGDVLALYWNDALPEGRGYYCSRDGWFGLDIWTPGSGVAEPVDVLTGGFPCQDVSAAGKRAGMKPGTRSGLWTHFAYAIDQLRPELVVIENVRGLLSAEAHSELEQRPELLAGLRRRDGEPVLRALGAVLGDLADLGYDAQWVGLRAADVGGCHGRFRVFVVAHPQGHPWRLDDRDGGATPDTERGGREWGQAQLGGAPGHAPRDGATATEPPNLGHQWGGRARAGWPRSTDGRLIPTPTTRDHKGHSQRRDDTCLAGALLPTPRATDGTHGGPNQRGSSGDLMLPSAVAKLLPTPMANEGDKAGQNPRNSAGQEYLTHAVHADRWGDYADAIARWANTLGRPAPNPTEPNPKTGRPRLSPRFEEWMMGLPDGWITNTPDVTWKEAVRMCGNGVVPQQSEAAVRWLLNVARAAA